MTEQPFNTAQWIVSLALPPDLLRRSRILVRPLEFSWLGHIQPPTHDRELPIRALVVAVGPGTLSPGTASWLPVLSQVGEIVSMGQHSGQTQQVETPLGWIDLVLVEDTLVDLHLALDSVPLVYHPETQALHQACRQCEHCPEIVANLKAIQDAGGAPEAAGARPRLVMP